MSEPGETVGSDKDRKGHKMGMVKTKKINKELSALCALPQFVPPNDCGIFSGKYQKIGTTKEGRDRNGVELV